jgi:hypothetical protein
VRRAEPEIRHISDPALILVTPEHVDVVARRLFAPKVVAPARASKARFAHGGHALLQCNNLPHGAALLDRRNASIPATPRSAQRRASAWGAVSGKGDPTREPDGRQRSGACERAGLAFRAHGVPGSHGPGCNLTDPG